MAVDHRVFLFLPPLLDRRANTSTHSRRGVGKKLTALTALTTLTGKSKKLTTLTALTH